MDLKQAELVQQDLNQALLGGLQLHILLILLIAFQRKCWVMFWSREVTILLCPSAWEKDWVEPLVGLYSNFGVESSHCEMHS